MKKLIMIMLAISLFFIANGQGDCVQIGTVDELDEFIIEQMDVYHVPGLSASIIIGDCITWSNNYGYMNLEDSIPVHDSTLFNVFSIGKSVTAACVMKLFDEGLIDLDHKVNDYLPFQIINPNSLSDAITTRNLLSHTSSIDDRGIYAYVVNGDPEIPLGHFLENYLSSDGEFFNLKNFYHYQPGTRFYYDNYGIALSGYLIEPIMDMSFNQFAHNYILSPLDMMKSAWFIEEISLDNMAIGYDYSGGVYLSNLHKGHPAYPGLTLRSTALELSNFVKMLLNNGVYDGQRILSEDAIDSMTTIQDSSWSMAYGITGLGIFNRDDYGNRVVWGHNGGSGGGYAAHYYFCKEENTGVVILTNSEQYVDTIVEHLFDYALSIVSIPEPQNVPSVDLELYPNPADESITIKYNSHLSGEGSLVIRNIEGQLISNIPVSYGDLHEFKINCSGWSPGIYFISLENLTDRVTQKIIVQ